MTAAANLSGYMLMTDAGITDHLLRDLLNLKVTLVCKPGNQTIEMVHDTKLSTVEIFLGRFQARSSILLIGKNKLE